MNGMAIPTAAMMRLVAISAALARLSKNGTLAVRMMWMMSVWVSKRFHEPAGLEQGAACPRR